MLPRLLTRTRRSRIAILTTSLLVIQLYIIPLAAQRASALSPTFGYLDQVVGPVAPGVVRVTGWAITSDYPTAALGIQILIDGNVDDQYYELANTYRPDVGAAYPGYGNYHGFDFTIAVPTVPGGGSGSHTICAQAQNSGVYNQLNNCYVYSLAQSPFFGGRLDHPHGTLLFIPYTKSGSYASEIDNAMSDWFNTPTPLDPYATTNYGISKVDFYTPSSGPSGVIGLTSSFPGNSVGTTILYSTIYLYQGEMNMLSADGRQGAAAHEAGHAFGLAHVPQSLSSIMRPFASGITHPQPYDSSNISQLGGIHLTGLRDR